MPFKGLERMTGRSAKAFETPIPEALAASGADVLYLHQEVARFRHETGGRMQEFEGRLGKAEKTLKELLDGHAAASAEILLRIGRDDEDGSYGLTGKVGGLERAIGAAPDEDGKNGRGILGRLATHDRTEERWAGLLNQVKGGLIAAAGLGAVLLFLLRDQLGHLFSVPVH